MVRARARDTGKAWVFYIIDLIGWPPSLVAIFCTPSGALLASFELRYGALLAQVWSVFGDFVEREQVVDGLLIVA